MNLIHSLIQESYRIIKLGHRSILMFFSVIALCFTASGHAATSTVTCQGSNDYDAIQNAINSASTGDTLNLVGTCQLDGRTIFINTSGITIAGAGAADNWSTVVSGCTGSPSAPTCTPNATGTPADDYFDTSTPNFGFFNRGFSIGPSDNKISDVIIEGIKFHNINRAVDVSPQIAGNTYFCNGISLTNGSASNITVSNNWFDSVIRPFEVRGAGDHISITNNLITNSGLSGSSNNELATNLLTRSGSVGCATATGDFGVVFADRLGPLLKLLVENNKVQNDNALITFYLGTKTGGKVNNNHLMGGDNNFIGIYTSQSLDYVISGNYINGSMIGILDNNPYLAKTSRDIRNNKISNIGLLGIGLDSDITTDSVTNNQFDSSGLVNIFLCDMDATHGNIAPLVCSGGNSASFKNTVITTNFSNTVLDLGVNNKLIGTQNLINNINVPSSVRAKLINFGKGRPVY